MAGLDELEHQGGALVVGEVVASSSQAHVVDADVGAARRPPRAARRRRRRPCGRARRRRRGRPELLVQDDLQVVQGVVAEADGDRDAGGQGGAGRTAEQALVGRRSCPRGSAVVATMPAAPRRSTRGTTMPSVTSLAKRSANFSAGHGVGRVGLRRQEVAAEHLLRAQARRRDDVHAGRARQGLVQLARRGRGTCRCCPRSSRRRARGSPSSFSARVSKISARSMVMSNAYSAPGNDRQQGLVDRDDPQLLGGNGAKDGIDGVAGGVLGSLGAHHWHSSRSRRVTAVTRPV